VTCRLTFGREILCCCGGIVGNVSRGASERLHSLEAGRDRRKVPHSADGIRETAVLDNRYDGGRRGERWREEVVV
jgi:hypothetical protein